MTPAHDSLRDDVGLYAVGGLDADARAAFESHLATCAECRDELRSLTPVVAALAHAVPQVQPSSELRGRVLVVSGRAVRDRDRSWPATVVASRGAWFAAAAALVVAVGLGGYASRLQARIGALGARLADAERALSETRAEMVEARRALGDAQSNVRVLLAPDLARVDLAGPGAARGRVYYSPSTGLLFTATNLPPLPAGRTLQLWVVTAAAPVSAGLLAADASGAATVVFDAPPVSGPPVAFAVTLEPAGGVPAPTGDKVLVGLVE
jgi:anti-sigma-K factor RskA